MIIYQEFTEGIAPRHLTGFFEGWRKPLTAEQHLKVLGNSDHIVLAIDSESKNVVGFITALTDGIQAAFIPLLEVLPAYRQQGIGSELVRRMLKTLDAVNAVDLTCDPALQPFYARFDMQPSVGMVIRRY